MTQPQPGELDERLARAPVAGLADALLTARAAAGIGTGCQAPRAARSRRSPARRRSHGRPYPFCSMNEARTACYVVIVRLPTLPDSQTRARRLSVSRPWTV